MGINRSHVLGATSGAVLTAAAAFITPWEGTFTHPYLDIVGVQTVCIGETAADGVAMRDYTVAECKAMLPKHLVKYDDGMKACLNREIPDSMHIAFISATYNIGVHGFCHSRMAVQVNAGNLRAACDALLNWNKAGGREIKGLTNRRVAERKKCLEGL